MPSLFDYLIIGFVAAAVTFLTTPVVSHIGQRRGWVAQPNDRSVHTTAIPNVGGLGMLLGLLIALAFAQSLDRFDALFDGNIEQIGVILAALAITAIGFFDDTRDLAPPAKVTGIVVAQCC